MHTLREFLHNVHALRRLKCRHDLALRGIRLAHAHVFQKAALDETAVLAHEGHRIHQLILVHVLHIHAADQHIAALRIKESGEQVRQRVQAHGHAHFLGVGDRPALVIINGGLEFLEREHRLTEGLDYGNASDVFNGLAGHIRQRILVLGHFLLHTLAGHLRHDGKAQRHRREAQQTQPPVKNRQQGQQSYDGRHDLCLVRELMRQIRFRRTGGFGDGATESAAAELLDGAQRQGSDMPCHGQPQIGGNAERGQV